MTHQPADAVAQWNSRYPIGTPVTAYPGLRPEDDPAADRLITRTRSEAQALGGHTAVVWVDGHDACVALSHVDPVQPADTYTPPAKYQRSDGATCCPHTTPVAPGSCEACWDLVKWNAVDARLIPSSPAAVSAAVAPPTDKAADEAVTRALGVLRVWRDEREIGPEAARLLYEVGAALTDGDAELRRMADETATETPQPDSTTLLELVRDFLDPDPCSFDHHGYCQAHGYLGGEPLSCPHGRARKLLAELEQPAAGARQDGAES